jgi:PGF-CTERM protein
MYDVNFGGIEQMTKRLTIALVALALFVLVAVMPVSAAYYTVAPQINQGATVFIGEQGLNLTPAQLTAWAAKPANATTTIGWWASAAQLGSTSPTKTIDLTGRNTSFMVSSSDFVGYTGNWYMVDALTGYAVTPTLFTVADPSLDIKVWDFNQSTDVTGKSVPQGEYLGFRVDTNMYPALDSRYRSPVTNTNADGYLDIKVKSESGTTYTSMYYTATSTQTLVKQNVSYQPWTWGSVPSAPLNWSTGVLVNGQYAYPAGTYTISVESKLNAMKDNYKNAGADYTGKTVSQSYTITLVSDTIKIEANKDSVVRSKPFSITITGKPSTTYVVWVKGTSTMQGGYDDQPPMINQNQDGVKLDNFGSVQGSNDHVTPYIVDLQAGSYQYQNGGGNVVWDDVAKGTLSGNRNVLGNGTYMYANVTTSSSGTRTVEFITSNWTKAQKYTIRVEANFNNQYKSDEVDVKVEKGAVTIVAAGDQSYYLGEEIKFSGTNTESYKTYLFIIGPNLATNGASLTNPRTAVTTANFENADVQSDNTWSYKWGTSSLPLDAGTYTVYAVSQPVNKESGNLDKVAYGTVSIIIKKPFVSATASQSTVAKGDKIFITGTAEGQPSAGVQIWILGKNFDKKATEAVNSDSSFSYEVTQDTTKTLYAGQYFVVVQHPMQNNQFDIDTDVATGANGGNVFVQNKMLTAAGTTTPTTIFKLEGTGSLQGSDAAEALVQGINDPNVDDTYTKLQFLIEEPIITVDPIGDKHVGDKFTITAQTNLAVDDEILVQVYSSSFNPTQKSQSGEFSGATGTVKVQKGDSGMNKITFDVDSSTFKPDEYLVTEEAVIQEANGNALFNVLESVPQTVTPTVTATATPSVPATTMTTVATPTPTPTQSPGYGALIALIGLGAVAFIVVRRH